MTKIFNINNDLRESISQSDECIIQKVERTLQNNWKKTLFFILLFTVLYELFLTQGMDFFWEDYMVFGLSESTPFGYKLKEEGNGPQKRDAGLQFALMATNFFTLHQTLVIGTHGDNAQPLFSFFGALYSNKLALYRSTSLVLLCGIISFLFFIFRKLNELFFGLLAILFYLSFPQIWEIAVAPTGLVTLIMHTTTAASLFIYFFFYQTTTSYKKMLISFFLIIFLTRFSILLKNEGRIVFVIIFLYLLISDWKKLKQTKNYVLILSLFLTSYPFLTGVSGLITQNQAYGSFGMFIFTVLSKANVFLSIYGSINLLLFVSLIFVFSLYIIKVKWRHNHDFTYKENFIIFSFLWFLFALLIPLLGRAITEIGPKSWFIADYLYTLLPFVLFLFLGFSFVFSAPLIKDKKYIFVLFLIILFSSYGLQVISLNQFVGVYREYFIGYDTGMDLLASRNIENSLVLVPFDGITPPASLNITNNYVSSASFIDLQNISFLNQTKGNLSALYIISNSPMSFTDHSAALTLEIYEQRTDSLYAKLKKLVKRKTRLFYIYQLL